MNERRALATSLPWTIGALLLCYLPQAPGKPLWISALLLAAAGLRLVSATRGLAPLPGWLRTPIGVACFLIVLYSYGGINGVVPGSALLTVMAAMKLLETRNRRDQTVLLFICLFMMLATFLQEQTIWSVLYLLLAFSATMTAWNAVSRRGEPRPARWLIRQSGILLVMTAPLLAAMWVLFPRVPGPFWAIPTQAGSGSTGLSSTMSPGDISALSESNEVAFRVRFDARTPAQEQLYWRAIVMQRFDGRSWSADEPTFVTDPRERIVGQGEPVSYSVTIEPTRQRWLFTLDMPLQWQGEGLYLSRQLTLERRRPVEERLVYSATSDMRYLADQNLTRRARAWYTGLPEGSNPEARRFAQERRAAAGDDVTFINQTLEHFREQPFYYTLSPPPLGRESVDEFLFGTRRGFCEHYASSFAFMMRAAGIPARIVAGYQGGEQNPLGDYLIVRQSDAHAWTEVWLAERGWVRVDPTAAVAPQRIEQNLDSALRELGERSAGAFELPIMERLQLVWDMVNARWNEWILGFGPETQRNFFEWLGLDDPDWRDLTVLLAIFLVAIMTVIALWLAWQHRAPTPDPALRQYRRLQKKLKLSAAPGEPPLEFAARAGALRPALQQQIDAIVWHYLRARYADDARAAGRLATLVSDLPRSARRAA